MPGQRTESATSYYFWGCTRKNGWSRQPFLSSDKMGEAQRRQKISWVCWVTDMAHIYLSWVTAWCGTWTMCFCGGYAEITVTTDLTILAGGSGSSLLGRSPSRHYQPYDITAKVKDKSGSRYPLVVSLRARLLRKQFSATPKAWNSSLQRVRGPKRCCP